MGYTLTIGEAKLSYEPEDLYLTIEAEGATHEDAPDHDRFTGKSNSRSPSYTAWADFCREAGLYELFYGQGWDRNLCQNRDCTEGLRTFIFKATRCGSVASSASASATT